MDVVILGLFLGEDILQSIDRIPNPDTSELVAYIRKLLANGVAKAKKGTSAAAAPGAEEGSARKKSTRFSNSDHEALADIFKKIGQKELSKVNSLKPVPDKHKTRVILSSCLRNIVDIKL